MRCQVSFGTRWPGADGLFLCCWCRPAASVLRVGSVCSAGGPAFLQRRQHETDCYLVLLLGVSVFATLTLRCRCLAFTWVRCRFPSTLAGVTVRVLFVYSPSLVACLYFVAFLSLGFLMAGMISALAAISGLHAGSSGSTR